MLTPVFLKGKGFYYKVLIPRLTSIPRVGGGKKTLWLERKSFLNLFPYQFSDSIF